ncbi:MAG: dienelactone hydrolase family protein, partial [Candidatus Marinimicrobia bacterium]|nr:dienelactone hydrolase family protein [Candidatus Neomarinimicrobiota bacterium]
MNLNIRLRASLQLIAILLVVTSLENCSIVFPVIAPFADLPEPNGNYSVATRTTTWIDSSRDETFTPAPDYRRIVVQVWYPVEKSSEHTPKLYIDDPTLRLPAIAKQLRLPVSMIKQFDGVRTHSYTEISTDSSGSKFPVILFSHGLSGMRFQNTALMEELASQGYVVFAADHSYAANITIFDNGEMAEYRAGKRRPLNEELLKKIDLSQLSIVVDDLEFMLKRIRGDAPKIFLKNLPYNKNLIGVIGHSLGGAAILDAMAIDANIQAAMVLDGWYIPLPDSILARGIDQPIFLLGQIQWADPRNYIRMEQM